MNQTVLRSSQALLVPLACLCITSPTRGDESAINLLEGPGLAHFRPTTTWKQVESVAAVPEKTEFKLAGTGDILVNGATKTRAPYLTTKEEFQDVELHLEFMVPNRSNAGVYLQGRYEIQVFDSFGVREPKHSDLGGIYQRWDAQRQPKGYEGIAPLVNASRPPGEWQTLDIVFRGPRFDEEGSKIENARFVKVMVNGQLAQENREVTGPTRAAQFPDEKPSGPILIQGDHGPIAIRKFTAKRIELP